MLNSGAAAPSTGENLPQRYGSPDTAHRFMRKLRVPVIAAPMFIVSTPDLVIAQCKAGVVGSIPALNARPKERLHEWIVRIKAELAEHDRTHPDKPAAPFAVNQVAHRTNDRFQHDMDVIANEEVPLVIVSLAAPQDVLGAVHAYGGLVFNDVINVRHARKCADAGVDGLIAVAVGAGGHTGAISPFGLVEEIREFWDGPLGLGGAISTGRGILAAQALGADFAYIGSTFIATEEANAQAGYKQMLIEACAEDIVTSNRLTGVKANFMRKSLIAGGYDLVALARGDAAEMAFGEGGDSYKAWRDVWSAGHGAGAIKRQRPVAEIIAMLDDEYREARSAFCHDRERDHASIGRT